MTKPPASLHETDLFSSAATKGWAWCKHNAELVERTAALRDLKLLVGSGGLDFPKGMDSCNKHVEQNLFRQCITFCEHGQLKGWQPRFQPTLAKNSISTTVHWFASVTCHNWERNQYPVIQSLDTITVLYLTNLGDDNSVTKPSASLRETGFVLQLQWRDGNDASIMQDAWNTQEE